MGKLFDRLSKQLLTEHKKDAEDCIKIYNKLKELQNGRVWSSTWNPLVSIQFEPYPKDGKVYKPSSIGYVFLKGIDN
jgi:hypothetical protein